MLSLILLQVFFGSLPSQSPAHEPIIEKQAFDADAEVPIMIFLEEPPLVDKLARRKRTGGAITPEIVASLRRRQADLQIALTDQLQARSLAVPGKHRFRHLLNGITATARLADLEAIRGLPGVARVVEDSQVSAAGNQSVALINAPEVWDLMDDLDRPVLGTGIRIAIIDTGVDYTHPDLGGGFGPGFRVEKGYDLHNDDNDPMDDEGHGTHVAGIAAGNGEMVGVAPGATIHAYKVLGSNGNGLSSTIVAGIEMAVDPDGDPLTDDGADVINLSLGGVDSLSSPTVSAVEQAVAQGVVVVAAAGNEGAAGRVIVPALAPSVIAVGSASGPSADFFSSCVAPLEAGVKPEITAPGQSVYSTLPGGGYGYNSGTSMSSPHIAGAVALILQMNPDWTPKRIKRFLVNRTDHLAAANLTCMGAGLVNLAHVDDPRILEWAFPAELYGTIDLESDRAELSRSVEIFNVSAVDREVRLTEPDPASGISFESMAPVTVPANGSATLPLTMRVDNETVPFSPTPHILSSVEAGVLVGEQEIPFLHLFRKAFVLSLETVEDQYFQTSVLRHSDGHFDYYGMETKGEVYLSPDDYTVLMIEADPFSELRMRVTSTVLALTEDMTTHPAISHVDRDQFTPIEFEITDVDGSPFDLAEQRAGGSEDLFLDLNGHALLWYTYAGFSPGQYAVGRLEGVSTNFVGYAKRPGRNEYVSYCWFDAADSEETNHRVSLDLADYALIDWVEMGTSTSPPSLMIHHEGGSKSSILAHYLEGPGPHRFKTWEPIVPDPDTVDPRRFIARSLFGFDSGVHSRPPVVATSATTLTRVEINEDGITEIEDMHTSEVAVGRYLTLPRTAIGTVVQDGAQIPTSDWSEFRPLTDLIGHEYKDEEMVARLVLPDQSAVAWSNLPFLRGMIPKPMPSGEYLFAMDYTSRLRGEAVPARLEQRFVVEGTEPVIPNSIARLRLTRDGKSVEAITGSEVLTLDITGPEPASVVVAFDRGNGWEPSEIDRVRENRYTVGVPEPGDEPVIGLRIEIESASASSLAVEVPRAFPVGYTDQLPWIVANEQWTSRIALTNTDPEPAPVRLIARDRDGSTETISLTLPGQSTTTRDAASLFAMSGYNLTVVAQTDTVHASFLTLTQRPGLVPSPAQTAASDLATPSAMLSFGNLEGDQIPAIVLSAPLQTDDRVTIVELEYLPRAMPSRTTTVTLTGGRPLAATVADLFPEEPLAEDGWLVARAPDGVRLTGTVFGFNDAFEPSMSQAVSTHRQPGDLVLPWLVDNETWAGEVSIISGEAFGWNVSLTARSTEGEVRTRDLVLTPFEVAVFPVDELFPGLTRYTLTIHASFANLSAALRTSSKTTPSGRSPARVVAAVPFETSPDVLFGYLAGDQVPAVVLVAPWAEGSTDVLLTLMGEKGVIAETQIQLTGAQPAPHLVSDLFPDIELPEHMSLRARSLDGTSLTGTSFTFNENGEPSMAKTVPIDR